MDSAYFFSYKRSWYNDDKEIFFLNKGVKLQDDEYGTEVTFLKEAKRMEE